MNTIKEIKKQYETVSDQYWNVINSLIKENAELKEMLEKVEPKEPAAQISLLKKQLEELALTCQYQSNLIRMYEKMFNNIKDELRERVVYDPRIEEESPCFNCSHPYRRHFDPYEDNDYVGCKYCGCGDFQPTPPGETPHEHKYEE